MDKECTRHYWCSLRQFSQGGEVNPSLPDLHLLLPALVRPVACTWVGLLLLLALGAILDEMPVTPASETSVTSSQAERWLHILPRTLLLLGWRKSRSSLLWGPSYLAASRWCSLRCCGWNHTEPLWLPTRNGSRSLPLFLGSVSQDSILLRDGQVDQFDVGSGPHG